MTDPLPNDEDALEKAEPIEIQNNEGIVQKLTDYVFGRTPVQPSRVPISKQIFTLLKTKTLPSVDVKLWGEIFATILEYDQHNDQEKQKVCVFPSLLRERTLESM